MRAELENHIKSAISEIRDEAEFSLEKKLVSDLGFESLDIIDLIFEIQRRTSIQIDINELSMKIGGIEGRRFNDITIEDIVQYLLDKKNN